MAMFVALAKRACVRIAGRCSHGAVAMWKIRSGEGIVVNRAGVNVAVLKVQHHWLTHSGVVVVVVRRESDGRFEKAVWFVQIHLCCVSSLSKM